jgi:4-amino-4-deoxy-L-arabinose transferase-like glycosyltransferase
MHDDEPRPAARTSDLGQRDRRRTRGWVLAAVAVGLCARLAFSLFYWVDKPLTRDEREYLSLARSLAAGDGFVYDRTLVDAGVEPVGRAPGYPVFLALAGGAGGGGSVPTSVKIAQSVVGALGILIVSGLAGRLAGPSAARAAAVLAACYPPLVWIAGYAFSEALFWPIGLLVARAIDRIGSAAPGVAAPVMGGVLTAVSALVRPGMLLMLPLAVAWLLATRRWRATGVFVGGAALVLLPWMGRNVMHHGRFDLVASEGGVTFWTGNHPLARGEGDLAANPQLSLARQALRSQHPQLTEEQMEPVYYRDALAWMRRHPMEWLTLEGRKLFYLVVPVGPSYTLHSTRYLVASLASYGILLPLAVIGFIRLGRGRRRTPGLWLLAGSSIAMSLVFFPQERFRLAIIDPTMIVCAAALWGARPEPSSR